MKKIAVGLASLAVIGVGVAILSMRMVQAEETHESDDAGTHPIHRVFASLVEDGTLTEEQA